MKTAVYEAVIGIETHVQLRTKTKLFCACLNVSGELEPNTVTCPICMGLPGTLPVLNEQAVHQALKVGLAINGTIARTTKFDRKNYFYPDLPKGYQISQYDEPIIGAGEITITVNGKPRYIKVTRAHLEEDAGKLMHPEGADYSLLDLNRAGTPLMEIVSEPDMRSAGEAKAYAQELYLIMRYAGVSDVDLYLGNMRFDVNVSVRKRGTKELGTRTETKNLNSFRSIEKAVDYETSRQVELLEKGGTITQETRGWDDAKGKTISQRSKEEAHDYRYFPEPDLPPLAISEAMIQKAYADLPQLPREVRAELKKSGIGTDQIEVLVSQPALAALQLELKAESATDKKRIANWLVGEVRRLTSEQFDWEQFWLDGTRLVALSKLVSEGKLSSTGAKTVLTEMMKDKADPIVLAGKFNLLQVSDNAAIAKLAQKVIDANPQAVADYKSGNQNSLQFLVGQLMKESKGQANPQLARELLEKHLK